MIRALHVANALQPPLSDRPCATVPCATALRARALRDRPSRPPFATAHRDRPSRRTRAACSAVDKRLDKLCELAAFIMEAFEGVEDQFQYSVVGHSGTGPEALPLIAWGKPPQTPREKLKLIEELRTHAQYCNPGDATLDGTRLGIADCLSKPADEHFVFVVSDADLERYGITPKKWDAILTADARCHAYAILISQNEAEAGRIVAGITPGRALLCDQTDALASTFMTIFSHAVL